MPASDNNKIDNMDAAVHAEDGSQPEDPAALRKRERRLVLKIDLYIIPLIAIVYFFASMVRDSN